MSTEDGPPGAGQGAPADNAADDPFNGWAEALKEQKRSDEPPAEGQQGGPLSGEPVRPPLAGAASGASAVNGGEQVINDINRVLDIPVQLSVELGRTKVPIKYILQLAQGSVVELDALAGEPMDVLVNGYLIAQGEVVVVNDKFGIRLTDVVTPSERLRRVSRG
ncbi:flagellar motor switch protein FliN [Verminephrobacter eiseniae]|uniref:Flagellar motor switch protein FliN n=1 Tax=Verminephrobacter eiseniae (strain EF01-2) TaxID=391735 RepID=A1WGY8_VEREI|nr:flagellar motor switch protein FliN [Verminephrobacter eiseniae]ABM56895.1 flagellar motor switch protein FliN [Verminephrobacter eiseniae EF01-2]MCW5287241.1 flagellar motor switch protein FliN [Verminephrobacter eiseniae]MCW5305540.1 flagellar motor switch protein FliN [Verminephrobacter eiseniae]MCW8181874.1 flagellar motor switch protein FliN [Verminephrobacter eiseniae]MCW8191435.1 flagellar motor switch protein FliN [Verminephrobacter eiseniae]